MGTSDRDGAAAVGEPDIMMTDTDTNPESSVTAHDAEHDLSGDLPLDHGSEALDRSADDTRAVDDAVPPPEDDLTTIPAEEASSHDGVESPSGIDAVMPAEEPDDWHVEDTAPVFYSIDLDPPEADDGDMYRVTGRILNLSDTAWDQNHRIAVRNFRFRSGQIASALEVRGQLDHAPVNPGEETGFVIEVNPEEIGRGVITCELDVVNEGFFWYTERGAQPTTLSIRGFRNPNARMETRIEIARIARSASPDERRKLEVVQDVLRQFDFGGYDRIQTVRRIRANARAGTPQRPPIASSRTIVAALGRGTEAAARRAAFFRSYAIKQGTPSRDLDNFFAVIEPFVRFAREGSGTTFRNATPPLPLDFVRWLGSRAIPAELARNPLSRSMLATLGDRVSINLNKQDDFINLAWVFATAVMIDGNLSADLFPEAVYNHLAVSPETTDPRRTVPEITGFMARLHRDDRNYHDRYDLGTDAGRCAYAFDLLVLGTENEARRTLIGRDMLAWLTAPIGPSVAASPFEIIACANAGDHRAIDFASVDELDPDLLALRRAFDWLPAAPARTRYPLRVIGRHASQSGLGTNMRMSLQVLGDLDIAAEIVDTDLDLVIPAVEDSGFDRPIDLYHLNLDDVPTLVARYTTPDRPVPYRIGFALWESSAMPEQHRSGAELMDEIWVPTQYLEKVYRNAGFTKIHVVGKAIDVAERVAVTRSEYDLDEDVFVFLTSFDIDSWVERKNPSAAIEAFQRAFPTEQDVRLIVKTTGIFSHPGDKTRQVARVLAAADEDDRIVLVNERMPFDRYLGIIGAADAVVSAHRSEGFGYLPAYAMMMGIPAIVTDHSGTEDFCTSDTSFPVLSQLIPIAPGDFVYDVPGAVWADVNIDAMAEAMRVARTDEPERLRRAASGKRLVETLYSYEAMGNRYRERLEAITG